jgi:YaiO family outer membrane protein
LGRLYARDRQFDAARKQIEEVLHRRADYIDAYSALVDVDRWSGNLDAALRHSIEGLSHDPTSESLLYKKALTLKDLDQLNEAKSTLRRLLSVNSLHEKGRQFLDRLELLSVSNAFHIDYGFEDIDSFDDPWHLVSLEFSRATGIGSLLGHLNYASRFGRSTIQYEVDAYPNIAKSLYAYLNFGYSPSGSFPEYRYGAELFADLSGGVELSLGFRHLKFQSSGVTVYTGSIGKYFGNYWISLRPYITPKPVGSSKSYKLSVRRYFGTADSFLGVSVSAGSNPGDALTTVVDLIRLESRKIRLDAKLPLGRGTTVDWFAGYGQEDLPFGRKRTRFKVGLGFERRF